ncbi:hypothetical protein OAT42_03885 [Alphaproteobacteria bacterium]|nr:hypothetical protein [Alphaproteobacteria bacterium]
METYMYAIKVWTSKNENDWFLLRDLNDSVVHIWTRKEKAQEVLEALTCPKAEITQEIPAAALLKATEKKQNQKNV